MMVFVCCRLPFPAHVFSICCIFKRGQMTTEMQLHMRVCTMLSPCAHNVVSAYARLTCTLQAQTFDACGNVPHPTILLQNSAAGVEFLKICAKTVYLVYTNVGQQGWQNNRESLWRIMIMMVQNQKFTVYTNNSNTLIML